MTMNAVDEHHKNPQYFLAVSLKYKFVCPSFEFPTFVGHLLAPPVNSVCPDLVPLLSKFAAVSRDHCKSMWLFQR